MGTIYRGKASLMSLYMVKHVLGAILAAVLLTASLVFLSGQGLFGGGLMVLGALICCTASFGWVFLFQNSRVYLITSRGVAIEFGFIFRTNQRELSFRRIQVVDVHQNLIEKFILRSGHIYIGSAANDNAQDMIVFAGVRNPHYVAGLIREGEDGIYQQDPNPSDSYSPYDPPARRERSSGPAPWDSGSGAGRAPWDRSGGDAQSGWDNGEHRPPLPPG